uniref:Uncharacterized protein n=1 Tax=Anguilla anguilla TaxID=7936 RepID=A0A0E9USX4_ANGAN
MFNISAFYLLVMWLCCIQT